MADFHIMTAPNPQPQSQAHLDTPLANPNARLKRIAGRNQAADLQRFAYDAAMSLRAACTDKESGRVTMDVKTAVAVQKLIGAWDTAADRLRVLRGRGLPAVVKSGPKVTAQPEPLEQV
jgi:hypothetical protein